MPACVLCKRMASSPSEAVADDLTVTARPHSTNDPGESTITSGEDEVADVFLEDDEDWEYEAAPGNVLQLGQTPANAENAVAARAPGAERMSPPDSSAAAMFRAGFSPTTSRVEAVARMAAVKDLLCSEIKQIDEAIKGLTTEGRMDYSVVRSHLRRSVPVPVPLRAGSPSAPSRSPNRGGRGCTRSSLTGQQRPASAQPASARSSILHKNSLVATYGDARRGGEWSQEMARYRSTYEESVQRAAAAYGVQRMGRGTQTRGRKGGRERGRPASAIGIQGAAGIDSGVSPMPTDVGDTSVGADDAHVAATTTTSESMVSPPQGGDNDDSRSQGATSGAVATVDEGGGKTEGCQMHAIHSDSGGREGTGIGTANSVSMDAQKEATTVLPKDISGGIAAMIVQALEAKKRASAYMQYSHTYNDRQDSFLDRLAALQALSPAQVPSAEVHSSGVSWKGEGQMKECKEKVVEDVGGEIAPITDNGTYQGSGGELHRPSPTRSALSGCSTRPASGFRPQSAGLAPTHVSGHPFITASGSTTASHTPLPASGRTSSDLARRLRHYQPARPAFGSAMPQHVSGMLSRDANVFIHFPRPMPEVPPQTPPECLDRARRTVFSPLPTKGGKYKFLPLPSSSPTLKGNIYALPQARNREIPLAVRGGGARSKSVVRLEVYQRANHADKAFAPLTPPGINNLSYPASPEMRGLAASSPPRPAHQSLLRPSSSAMAMVEGGENAAGKDVGRAWTSIESLRPQSAGPSTRSARPKGPTARGSWQGELLRDELVPKTGVALPDSSAGQEALEASSLREVKRATHANTFRRASYSRDHARRRSAGDKSADELFSPFTGYRRFSAATVDVAGLSTEAESLLIWNRIQRKLKEKEGKDTLAQTAAWRRRVEAGRGGGS